jgi:two-component system LytT family sensor kinase
MILQPLVENAVEHGMRKIKEGGLIRVEMKFNNHDWEITVEDNGPGIQNMIKEQLETAKRKKHRS